MWLCWPEPAGLWVQYVMLILKWSHGLFAFIPNITTKSEGCITLRLELFRFLWLWVLLFAGTLCWTIITKSMSEVQVLCCTCPNVASLVCVVIKPYHVKNISFPLQSPALAKLLDIPQQDSLAFRKASSVIRTSNSSGLSCKFSEPLCAEFLLHYINT